MQRNLARALPIALLVGASIAGCGSGGGGDPELTVYLSAPLRGPVAADGRDVADGAQLALDDAGGEAAGTPVRLVVLDDADAEGADAARAGANARTATEDSTAIAYLGELSSETTRTSLPITNEAGLLQVSPGALAVDLTRAAPGSDQVPDQAQPSGSRTFGRVIPSDAAQGAAAAGAIAAEPELGSVSALGSASAYGDSLRFGFESVAGAPAVAKGEPVDALYAVAARPVRGVPEATRSKPVVYGADAQIVGDPPVTGLPRGAVLVSGALAPQQLPAPADFTDRFRDAHDRSPGRFAAYGYEAMAVVLDAIERADDPLDRSSVVDAFMTTSDRDSVLGSYSIDEVGDTTLARVGAYVAGADGSLAPAPAPLAVP